MSELINLLESANVVIREQGANTGREHINICCPFCNETRFHCGIHQTEYWFKCFVCGEGGSWYKIRNKLRESNPKAPWSSLKLETGTFYTDEVKKEQIPQEDVFWREIEFDKDIKKIQWLSDEPLYDDIKERYRCRGVNIEDAMDYGLLTGIKRLSGYWVFKMDGNAVARKISGDATGPKWWKNTVDQTYLFGSYWTKRVQPKVGVITEGVFDCMRVPIGTGVAILGSAVSDVLVYEISNAFENAETLILALDRDANKQSVDTMDLMLSDLGFEVIQVNWDKVPNKMIKDIDEVFLFEGEDMLSNLLGSGILDDSSNVSLL